MTSLDHLTITDIAVHLDVSRWTVSRLVGAGEIPSTPGPGRSSRISPLAYRAWLTSQVVTPGQEDGEMLTALPQLIAFEKVAEQWDLSLRSLRDGARARKFAHVRIGLNRYFTAPQLEAFLAARTVSTAEDDAKAAMAERRERRNSRAARRPAA
ncbi:helix-turn-helix domain-containing protein [Actinoplanes sp. CA-252034]|uniref:helix-turn-helix domain-containing protein n=1 Tax=Actinoplanes sp. CA-252034 TaxID=3239906 RepID=UPI003D99A1AF